MQGNKARKLEDSPRHKLDAVLCRFLLKLEKRTVTNTNQKVWLSCSAHWTVILKTVATTIVFSRIVNLQNQANNLK